MTIHYIDELPIAQKRVLIRVDFNVPVENDEVVDDTRIRAALPTIQYALDQQARVILMSHRGRPKGKADPTLSLKPVGLHLASLLRDHEIIMPESCVGDGVKKLAADMTPTQIILLENLRFHRGEEANDDAFAKQLAANADVYINDAFGTAHRAHASTAGVARYLKVAGAGFLMREEITHLEKLLEAPQRPFIALLGGAKVSDKLGVIDNLLGKVDALLIGGGMAFTFLKAKGHQIGASLVEPSKIFSAHRLLQRAETRGIPIELPLDHLVASRCSADAETNIVHGKDIPGKMIGLDIGPKTIARFAALIAEAKTIFWNGPMGAFEQKPFATGTYEIAKAIAKSPAHSVVGGGDSLAALKAAGLTERIGFCSTGGGASLEFLEGKRLPGIEALDV